MSSHVPTAHVNHLTFVDGAAKNAYHLTNQDSILQFSVSAAKS